MRKLLVGFLVLAVTLALVQLYQFRNTMPPPDGIAYFEVADQIPQVGYARALPIHWSPLYPLYVLAGRTIAGGGLARELFRSAAGDTLLLVMLCATVGFAFRSIARLCWPDTSAAGGAWLAYACGLSLFLSFALLRVGLRMPDALVTMLVVATLWAWCQGLARDLDLRWCALAGVLSGGAFLARGNLLHWSLVVGVVACASAPAVPLARRVLAYAVFCLGLSVLFAPQAYVLSSARGYFTFGETGKIVFAQSYGADYATGSPAWPVRVNGGDVRIFTEQRSLNFPGFYDIGREFDDASILQHWWKMPWAIVRSADSCLFGNWSPSFALLWPMLWALWPLGLFEIWRPSARAGDRVPAARGVLEVRRRRFAWFLMLAGSAGGAMHLLSFCNAYYMPPYLMALLTGACLLVLDRADDAPFRRRAVWLVAAGFALVAVLSTARHARFSERQGRATSLRDAQTLSAALTLVPAGGGSLRKIAAAGDWLGQYGVRLSGSQVIADVPRPGILHDRTRAAAVVRALQELGVVVLLINRSEVRPDDLLKPLATTREWAVVDVRSAPAFPAGDVRP